MGFVDVDADTLKKNTDTVSRPSAIRECRLYRLGKTYRTMNADNHVLHRNDMGKLPEGATVIKSYLRYAYNQETIK